MRDIGSNRAWGALRQRGRALWLTIVVGGAALTWASDRFGAWWIVVVVGIIAGLALRSPFATISAAVLAPWLGWGGDLAAQATSANIPGAAGVLAAILGLSVGAGAVVIAVTFLFALLLALAGAWVGAALRHSVLVLARP